MGKRVRFQHSVCCWSLFGSHPCLPSGPVPAQPGHLSHPGSVLSQAISVSGSKGQCLSWDMAAAASSLPRSGVSPALRDGGPQLVPLPRFTQDWLGVPTPSFTHGFPRLPLGLEHVHLLTDSLTSARGENAH